MVLTLKTHQVFNQGSFFSFLPFFLSLHLCPTQRLIQIYIHFLHQPHSHTYIHIYVRAHIYIAQKCWFKHPNTVYTCCGCGDDKERWLVMIDRGSHGWGHCIRSNNLVLHTHWACILNPSDSARVMQVMGTSSRNNYINIYIGGYLSQNRSKSHQLHDVFFPSVFMNVGYIPWIPLKWLGNSSGSSVTSSTLSLVIDHVGLMWSLFRSPDASIWLIVKKWTSKQHMLRWDWTTCLVLSAHNMNLSRFNNLA